MFLNSSAICSHIPDIFKSGNFFLIIASPQFISSGHFVGQILNWVIPPISWSYFPSLYLSVNHGAHFFSYIFKYINSTLFWWKKINCHGQHMYSYWKFLMSPHIWFPTHRNKRLWKADSSVHSPRGPAKSGKCCRGNWGSMEEATQWKRAVSRAKVKMDTNNPIKMCLEDNLALRICTPALEIHPKNILPRKICFFLFYLNLILQVSRLCKALNDLCL